MLSYMTNKDMSELVKHSLGKRNSSFIERLSKEGKQFMDMLEKEVINGHEISPRAVSEILLKEFNHVVSESSISKWQTSVKTRN